MFASEHHHKHRAPRAADKIRCARAPCRAFGVACWLLLPFASAVSRRFISGRCPRNPGFLNLCVIGGRFHILLQFSALPEASGNLVPSLLERTSFTGRPGICSRRLPIWFGAALRHSPPLPCFCSCVSLGCVHATGSCIRRLKQGHARDLMRTLALKYASARICCQAIFRISRDS